MKVLLDTNWLISYLIKKETSGLRLLFSQISISIVTSEKQIREFIHKIYHPKLRKYFEIEEALEFIQNFTKRAELATSKTEIKICRDPKDNYLLGLAKDASVDFLITGDKDLLELKKFENTVICNLPDFIQNISQK